MAKKCENCTEKCPQAEMAHQAALGRMYATKEFTILLKKVESGELIEVVRCKDCVSFEETYHTVSEETGKVYCGGYCYHWDYEPGMSPNQVDGDDFCSYGERRPACAKE